MNELTTNMIDLLYTISESIKKEDTEKLEKLIEVNEDWPQPEREREVIDTLLISIHQLLEKNFELKDEAEEAKGAVTQIQDFVDNIL